MERSRRRARACVLFTNDRGVSPLAALVAVALAALGACRGPAPKPAPPPEPVEVSAPAWVNQPLSWEKLEAIESWLAHDAQHHEPSLVIEGQLVLNEGRLTFSQRDRDRASVSADTLRVRVEGAREGFAAVKADPRASPGQQRRAEIGMRTADALLGAPGPLGLAIVTRKQWGARAPDLSDMTALKGQWSKVTVHHSAETSSDPRGGSLEDSMSTLRGIQRFHMESNGWSDIGYHFVIDAAGRIFEGRELRWQGAHAGGVNNAQNIGICLLGDFERRSPTPAALKSLELLVGDLRSRFRIRDSRLYAHREFNTDSKVTVCPGDALSAWVKAHR